MRVLELYIEHKMHPINIAMSNNITYRQISSGF